jgi:putative PIN family toxin of toxin-antitoxin system
MNTAGPEGPLKVVLDTNVYFSAFNGTRGAPYKVWRRALAREYTLLVSPAIIRELADVLRRSLDRPEAEIIAQLKRVTRVAEMAEPRFILDVVAADPDDNRILECALAGNANLVVSGDRHLTSLKTFRGITILRPADFLRIL